MRKVMSIILSLLLVVSALNVNVLAFSDSKQGKEELGESRVVEDLIISEYVEGSSYNKAIEIFNGTGQTVDLSDYSIMKDSNGGGTFSNEFTLSGSLANGQVIVVRVNDSRCSDAIKDIAIFDTDACDFNGDDPIALYKNGVMIDRFGISGVNFGKDHTFIRNSDVSKGITSEVDPRSSSEWTSKSKDYIEDLGKHTSDFVAATKVEEVKASTPSGNVVAGTEISLTTKTEGATIYFTIGSADVTTASNVYINPIEITKETTVKAMATKDGLDNSEVSEFNYTIASTTSIADAKKITDEDQEVIIEGVVFNAYKGKYLIQDDNSGIVLYQKSSPITGFKAGDKIRATGTIKDYNGLTELLYTSIEKVSDGHTVVPKEITVDQVGEDYETVLVKFKDAKVTAISKDNEYINVTIEQNGKTVLIYHCPRHDLQVGDMLAFTAYVTQYKTNYQLSVLFGTSVENGSVYAPYSTTKSGLITGDTNVEFSTKTEGATIYYTLDGTTPTKDSTKYTDALVITKDTTIKAIAIKDGLKDSMITEIVLDKAEASDAKTIQAIQGKSHTSPEVNNSVTDIKGIVTAKINYGFDTFGDKKTYIKGFYMQAASDNDDATSDAIFVDTTNTTVKVGDMVKVDGIVKEYLKKQDFYAYDEDVQLLTTEIAASDIEVVSSGNELPAATVLGEGGRVVPHDLISSANFSEYNPEKYAIDFYESLEGMRIQINKPQVVSAVHNRVLSVVPDFAKIAREDGDLSVMGGVVLGENDNNTEIVGLNSAIMSLGSQANKLQPGATSTGSVVGVMDYEWGTYQMYVTQELPEFTNVERDVDSLDFETTNDELTIASYNVYNHGGKASSTKTKGIAKAIANNMKSPDIVGLVEVQDNDSKTNSGVVAADVTYNNFIDEIVALGGPTYKYVNIDPVNNTEGGQPGGNIRVGFLYNPERVSLRKTDEVGGSRESVEITTDGHLAKNPGRIAADSGAFASTRRSLAAEFEFKGESIVVIANHFSSKGGDTPVYGNTQPAVRSSEVNRVQQAQLVNNFMDEIIAKNADSKVVALGDLNDFHFSDTARILTGQYEVDSKGVVTKKSNQILTDMIDTLPLNEQFTYSYGGNSQVLDHIMVSNNVLNNTKFDSLNINTNFYDDDKTNRHSDHDAVVAAIKFATEPVEELGVNIEGIKLTDGLTNTEKTVFTKGEMVTIKSEVKSDEELSKDLIIYRIVKANKQYRLGVLNNVKLGNEAMETRMGFDTTGLESGNYTVELMVWDTLEDAKPLAEKETINFELN